MSERRDGLGWLASRGGRGRSCECPVRGAPLMARTRASRLASPMSRHTVPASSWRGLPTART